jgi:acetyl-CoA carboxylase biotin carboxyl carrier protein
MTETTSPGAGSPPAPPAPPPPPPDPLPPVLPEHTVSASTEALDEAIHGAAGLVDILRGSPATRLRIDLGDLSLEIQTGAEHGSAMPPPAPPAVAAPGRPAQASPLAQAAPVETAEPPAKHRHRIAAPLIGAFYRNPTPGEPPFVVVGDQVEAGQQLAIIEAMKLMNALVTDRAGVVAEIHVEDGAVVEFDQLVMSIEID